jgi:hypothetical protein
MLYVVLAADGPGETGIQDRFFQAQKQAQSFPVGSAGIHFIGLPLWPHVGLTFESPAQRPVARYRRKLDADWLQRRRDRPAVLQ